MQIIFFASCSVEQKSPRRWPSGKSVRLWSCGFGFDSELWVKPMTLKLVFPASLLSTQHGRDSVENKPASLVVVTLGKVPAWCARQVAGNS